MGLKWYLFSWSKGSDCKSATINQDFPGSEGKDSFLLFWERNCGPAAAAAAAAAKSLQSCSTLCDPIDGSPPASPVPGILQARTLEWVAISFSSAWKWKVKVKLLSHVWLLATPWTAAHQAPPSMGFSRQEYWSGVQRFSPHAVYWKERGWFPFSSVVDSNHPEQH